ncbi:hypothetical protein [Erwinia sorbitola]|uniref:Uncharacterized protein n=1 Tax=Erwinia sorbitola TaxID=2681984 RepID=A0A6I6EPT5_9GAMM|nr:hypothetical protein [Erwinia sorbitola]MTD27188.1 hypothetical protein [Erwinia sorbitola]QGU88741.1 hypothetical protein GN242_16580 [Erwinia sorbitola]
MSQFSDKTDITAAIPLILLMAGLSLFTPFSTAEKRVISLSQEQDGGDAGRACIYVHQGKAEFRIVKPGESCAPEITVNIQKS